MAQVNPFAQTTTPPASTSTATVAGAPAATVAAAAPAAGTTAVAAAPATAVMPPSTAGAFGQPAAASAVEDVSLDDNIKFHALEKFQKMKLNEVARIALIVFDEKNAPKLKKVDYFYDKQANAIWNVPKNQAVLNACVQKYGEPKIKFGCIIIKYDTDQYGNVLPNAGYQLLAYTFGKDKWPTLKQLHQMWGLQGHDLILSCREAEFQKIEIQPAPDCLFRANPQLTQEITEKATLLHDKFLAQLLGRQLSDQEIMAIVNGMPLSQAGVPGATPAGMPTGGAVNPFAAGAGTGAPASAAMPVATGGGTVAGANFADQVVSGTNQPTA